MAKKLLMGNEAMAFGAIQAGVGLVAGYPGTPSTEVLETVAKHNPGHIYVEWSINEKAALEVGAGAAYTGTRVLITMKQVGLNVASDPLMSLAYIGIKGGMVVLVADDPGPISSQTEQDTRRFARYANLPVFDPASPEEAYEMMGEAFAYSEKYGIPVLFRPTTRICHSCAVLDVEEELRENPAPGCGFEKSPEWVIFPRLSYLRHQAMAERDKKLAADFSAYDKNSLTGQGPLAVAASGIAYAHAKDILQELGLNPPLLKIATANPFPADLALKLLHKSEKVLVLEELDPVVEENLLLLAGEQHLPITVWGKRSGHLPNAGEYTPNIIRGALAEFFGLDIPAAPAVPLPDLPPRPPVLCAGCPHRASFYAVKKAAQGKKAIFTGYIGCYTLGNAKPLEMVDTCLCMGAGITMAQGLARCEKDQQLYAFIGDSTFFHSGITGVINAVYNQTEINLIILDNHTTAMTGHQPHPGLGKTMMGGESPPGNIEAILKACGVQQIKVADPLNLPAAIEAVKEAAAHKGVAAVIFRSPCAVLSKGHQPLKVDTPTCTGCRRCIKELGCPSLTFVEGKAVIDRDTCTGCQLCAQLCPVNAIGGDGDEA